MKNKIAFGCAHRPWNSLHRNDGLSSEGQAGFVLAVKITAVGPAIAGAGIILNKIKERVTFDNHTL